MSGIEAVYIFDEHNKLVLSHVFSSRPPTPQELITAYLAQETPRPSIIYLPTTNPSSILYSITSDALLFLSPTTKDIPPLLVLEFLHRVSTSLSEFLGSPLLPSKIDGNHDICIQVLSELCDSGLIANTEPNSLRDVVVDTSSSTLSRILGSATQNVPSLQTGLQGLSNSRSSSPSPITTLTTSQIPWRKSNVRHTSNELYVDIVEEVSAVFAPSGRPLSAFVNGTIAFTSKVSGIPDLLLTLTTNTNNASPSSTKLQDIIQRPVFHPCVRLSRWKSSSELSFVPPDGRFILAGYEVDLLSSSTSPLSSIQDDVRLPISLDIITPTSSPEQAKSLDEFMIKLTLLPSFISASTPTSQSRGPSPHRAPLRHQSSSTTYRSGSSASQRTAAQSLAYLASNITSTSSSLLTETKAPPSLEDVTVQIPLPKGVKRVDNLRASKGEAVFNPPSYVPSGSTNGSQDRPGVVWKLSAKVLAGIDKEGCILKGNVVGEDHHDVEVEEAEEGMGRGQYDYDDDEKGQNVQRRHKDKKEVKGFDCTGLMPRYVSLSFGVRGWTASGLRVDTLNLDMKRSRGVGEGLKPYKGVKYVTVSKDGMEYRC